MTTATASDAGPAHRAEQPAPHRSGLRVVWNWTLFVIGCAVLVLCAYMVKNAAHWDPHLGGVVPAFLIMFVLMVTAGKLILGGLDKAIGWIKQQRRDGRAREQVARP
jgi:peptidoglycan/LPS O-acetylase OafA/YrhL